MRLCELTVEQRQQLLLYFLHFLRCGTVLILSNATGLRTQTISGWLKKLADEGWVKPLGFARVDPSTGLSGRWWIPTRKDPREYYSGTTLRAIVRPLGEADAHRTRAIAFGSGMWFRAHEMEVSCALGRLMLHHRINRMPGKFESETFLRSVRLWSGAPRSPAQHAKCHIISVPDARVAGDSWTVNVEIESTIKSVKEYARYVEMAEEGAVALWVVKDANAGERLTTALKNIGRGRLKYSLLCTWDRLEDAYESAVERARMKKIQLPDGEQCGTS